jgi:hypothetical protein
MGLIKVAVKTGICFYAVKYTIDEGAWSSAEDAIKFKSKMCKLINENENYKTGVAHFQTYVPLPQVRLIDNELIVILQNSVENPIKLLIFFLNWISFLLQFELPNLPQRSELGFVTKHYYNEGVKGTIRFIKMSPCYIGQGVKKVSDSIKQVMDQPPAPVETK